MHPAKNLGQKKKVQTEGKAKLYVGCSGFSYEHWKGVFYPEVLSQRKWLEHYTKFFNTVELNITFYRLPKENIFNGWRKRTPEGFIFILKGSKLITHLKALKNVENETEEFLNRSKALEKKLGLILWQLKPSHQKDFNLLKKFIELLQKKAPNIRYAFEFRNKTWFSEDVYELIRNANMTICIADWPTGFPEPPDDFPYIYIRRHGPEGQAYRGCYSEDQLKELAGKIRSGMKKGKDVYVYFNNDIGGYAPQNALRLKEMIQN